MRLTYAVLAFCALLIPTTFASSLTPATPVSGVISHRVSGCDYFIVQTTSGYDVLEWFSGHDPDRGDVVRGNYETYGFHDVYDETADEAPLAP